MGDARSRPLASDQDANGAAVRRLSAGPLTVEIEDGMLRGVRWHGVEVVRGINCLVRDAHWGTLAATAGDEHFDESGQAFRYERRFALEDGSATIVLTAAGASDGSIAVTAAITALRDIATNRGGLTLLHPISGVAGTTLAIRHGDGSVEQASFPALIQPAQPAFDIAGLRHEIGGIGVEIAFEGEVFEMEDQRNWSDASFKTYCRPLALPTPYAIETGTTVAQRIAIRCTGAPKAAGVTAAAQPLALGPEIGRLPEVTLAVDADAVAGAEAMALLAGAGIGRLSLRVSTDVAAERLSALATICGGRGVDLEAVVVGRDPLEALGRLRGALDAAGIAPERVLALPEAYLSSYQPSGPWPDGPRPEAAIAAARAVFPAARIGGGMLTSFTEFNRCRPPADLVDYVGHGTTAIVHAADDRSVMETLEALPAIFASAAAIGQGRPYRLGLVSIGMRSNAYGPERAPDPAARPLAMAKADPRRATLFAAAFAVGAVAATEGSAVEALALGSPTGAFGIVREETAEPWPALTEGMRVFPLYHVVRWLAERSGPPRRSLSGLPAHVMGIASGREAVIANCGLRPVTIALASPAACLMLDEESRPAAALDANFLDRPAAVVDRMTLAPSSTAFLAFTGDLS